MSPFFSPGFVASCIVAAVGGAMVGASLGFAAQGIERDAPSLLLGVLLVAMGVIGTAMTLTPTHQDQNDNATDEE